MYWLTTLVIFSIAVTAGCSGRDSDLGLSLETAAALGALPGLRQSSHEALSSEYAQLVEERATPELLMRTPPPEEDNMAAGLSAVFAKHRLEGIDRRAGDLLPPGRFDFDAVKLQQVVRFCEDYREQRQSLRVALERGECDFGIDHTQGFFIDLTFLTAVRCCVRLEALAAAKTLFVDQDPKEAARSLAAMFRVIGRLAAEKHPATRNEAAHLRIEALSVLQAIAGHPKTDRPLLATLHDLVQRQLDSWPDDADACIGDRSLGLHTYEVIRSGDLLSLLTDKEKEQFREDGILRDLGPALARSLDDDEAYYLKTMREIIDGCDRPYYQRRKVFKQIRKDLYNRRNTNEHPFVADRILLRDIEKCHRLQAHTAPRAKSGRWRWRLPPGGSGRTMRPTR